MTKLVNRWLVAATCSAAALAMPQIAGADDKAEDGASAGASLSLGGANAEAQAPAADHPAKEEHVEQEKETKLGLGLDMVIGFGKTPMVTQTLPGTLATVPDTSLDSALITTESILMSGSYEITKNIGVGLRLPFTFGTFTAPGRQSRGTSAVGSLELEGEYVHHLNAEMKLIYALGVALPTAQGDEVPSREELEKERGKIIDQNSYDRFAVNRAAASSRGFEENALFEPKRLGFIPKVGFDYKVSHVIIQPYLKLENLVSTVSGAEHSYLGELILGTFLGYELHQYVDAGVRVWGNVPLTTGEGVGVLEPQVRGHIGNITPILGGVFPFAGPLTNPQFAGLRLALAARF